MTNPNLKIATIINYCTNDFRFINKCIQEALVFSSQVIVPVSDHFFNGEPERIDILEINYKENPSVTFIQYEFDIKKREKYGPHFWHNMSRWIGVNYLKTEIDFVLFLDADEIVEGNKFIAWLKTVNLHEYDSFKFLNYWYFRDTKYQAETFEDSVVMIKKSKIKPKYFFTDSERHSLLIGKYKDKIADKNGLPIIHHYSWVKTKEEMLKKVASWGHSQDREWNSLVEEEFSRDFNGKDFIHGYSFREVDPYFNTDLNIIYSGFGSNKIEFINVIYLGKEEVESIHSKTSFFSRILKWLTMSTFI